MTVKDNFIDLVNQLKKLGVIVIDGKGSGNIYFNIGKLEDTHFTTLGYREAEGNKPAYFFHNGCSGNILNPSKALNGVWNHSGKEPGPGGWYTFPFSYVEDILKKMIFGMTPIKNKNITVKRKRIVKIEIVPMTVGNLNFTRENREGVISWFCSTNQEFDKKAIEELYQTSTK